MKEGSQDYYIYPIFGMDGKIILYEIYDKCTKSIERLHAYGVDYKIYGSDVDDNQWVTCPKLQHKDG